MSVTYRPGQTFERLTGKSATGLAMTDVCSEVARATGCKVGVSGRAIWPRVETPTGAKLDRMIDSALKNIPGK